MTASRPLTITPYEDCLRTFLEADASTRGIVLTCDTYGLAISHRQRLNKARVRLREISRQDYPPDHPLHGTSIADGFSITLNRVPMSSKCEIIIQRRISAIAVREI